MAEREYRGDQVPAGPVTYRHGPDSLPRSDVVPGRCQVLEAKVRGMTHRYRVHVPFGYTDDIPAALMVFLDGERCHAPDGQLRGGLVLDNLVARRAIPMTVGVFVDPVDRAGQYDAFDARHADFLAHEIISRVAAGWHLDREPARRGICGVGAGGHAALTAAWMRPDVFGGAISLLGSFTTLPDGNPYPYLVRETLPKRLRILMTAASFDTNHASGQLNSLSENLKTAAAFAETGYDFHLVLGDGAHDLNHAGVLLPDALRWLLPPEPGETQPTPTHTVDTLATW